MKGRIHSYDTFGTVDGPGIRFVLFMQGCPLTCQYCHNPDSWRMDNGTPMSVEEVMKEIEPFVDYYVRSGGGITVSGGEPALQTPFVTALFRACKERWGLHTALDTSGFCHPGHVRELMDVTDLVLLDLKLIDRNKHRSLTGQSNERILHFAQWLSTQNRNIWIRHVLIPDINDDPNDLAELGKFIKTLTGVEKIEVLPYHRMGEYKWMELGKAYPLEGVPEPDENALRLAVKRIKK